MTSALTDVTSDVEAVFNELECGWNDETSHEGEVRAYYDYHGCAAGYWCASHYQRYIQEHVPVIHRLATSGGLCPGCLKPFWGGADTYVKVYPL